MPVPIHDLAWRAPDWLAIHGPLTPHTALAYFSLSPFFSRASANAALAMQTGPDGALHGPELERALARFTGTEYILAPSAPLPSLTGPTAASAEEGPFIVHRRERSSTTETKLTAIFYILNGTIYAAPSPAQLLSTRTHSAAVALTHALASLDTLRARMHQHVRPLPLPSSSSSAQKAGLLNSAFVRSVRATAAATDRDLGPRVLARQAFDRSREQVRVGAGAGEDVQEEVISAKLDGAQGALAVQAPTATKRAGPSAKTNKKKKKDVLATVGQGGQRKGKGRSPVVKRRIREVIQVD